MRRVSGLVEVRDMAVDTSGAGQSEIVIGVALGALHRDRSVRPYQRETSDLRVVEARAIPRVDGMTVRAGCGQL